MTIVETAKSRQNCLVIWKNVVYDVVYKCRNAVAYERAVYLINLWSKQSYIGYFPFSDTSRHKHRSVLSLLSLDVKKRQNDAYVDLCHQMKNIYYVYATMQVDLNMPLRK